MRSTPLTLAPDGEGRFTIIAGRRRYRAAKAAKLREVPAQVREADDEALALGVAENVIRADLNPVEEARAYRRLVDEHGDIAKVAALVGRASDWLPSASTSCARRSRPGAACRPPRSARLIVKKGVRNALIDRSVDFIAHLTD